MNKLQKKIFLAMIAVDAAMALYPPWHIVARAGGAMFHNKGYSFITDPPVSTASISLSTLSVQVAVVTFVCLALLYYFKTPKASTAEVDAQVGFVVAALMEGDENAAVEALKRAINGNR